jgi:hypothetical protein
MDEGAHPGRPRVRLRVPRSASSGGRVGRALKLARRIDHMAAGVIGAHSGLHVPHLDQTIAGARAPKRLAAITRLARVPGPAVRPEPATFPARPAPAPAPPIVLAREVAPMPSADADVGDSTPVQPAFAEPPPEPQAQPPTASAPRLLRSPAEPAPPDLPEDMKFLWDVWQREKPGGRGVLERGRGARIEEGSAPHSEAPAGDGAQLSRVTAEPPLGSEPPSPVSEHPSPPSERAAPVNEPPSPASERAAPVNEPPSPASGSPGRPSGQPLRRLARQPAAGSNPRPTPEDRQPAAPPSPSPATPGAMRMSRKPSDLTRDAGRIAPDRDQPASGSPAGAPPRVSRTSSDQPAAPPTTPEQPAAAPAPSEPRSSSADDAGGSVESARSDTTPPQRQADPVENVVAPDPNAPAETSRGSIRLARSSKAAPPPASPAGAQSAATTRPVRLQRRAKPTTVSAPTSPPAATPERATMPARATAAATATATAAPTPTPAPAASATPSSAPIAPESAPPTQSVATPASLASPPGLLRRALSRVRRNRDAGNEPVSLPTPTSAAPDDSIAGSSPELPTPPTTAVSIATTSPRPAAAPSPTAAPQPVRARRVARLLRRSAGRKRSDERQPAPGPTPAAQSAPQPHPRPSSEPPVKPSADPEPDDRGAAAPASEPALLQRAVTTAEPTGSTEAFAPPQSHAGAPVRPPTPARREAPRPSSPRGSRMSRPTVRRLKRGEASVGRIQRASAPPATAPTASVRPAAPPVSPVPASPSNPPAALSAAPPPRTPTEPPPAPPLSRSTASRLTTGAASQVNGGATLARQPALGGASWGASAMGSVSSGAGSASSGSASSAGGGQGDSDADQIYRELLHRLRAEQEQLGQVVDEPF